MKALATIAAILILVSCASAQPPKLDPNKPIMISWQHSYEDIADAPIDFTDLAFDVIFYNTDTTWLKVEWHPPAMADTIAVEETVELQPGFYSVAVRAARRKPEGGYIYSTWVSDLFEIILYKPKNVILLKVFQQ